MRQSPRSLHRLTAPRAALALMAVLMASSAARADDDATAAAVDFLRDVRPILESRCYECHGSDTREAGLRLDRKGPALAGGDAGRVVTPGDAEHSPLVRRITTDDPLERMPPDDEPLASGQIEVLKRWIDAGARWPDGIDGPPERPTHWAYQPLTRPEPPVVGEALSPIDAFVRQRLGAEGIDPSPEADRYTLIKRLYDDLLGLPPDPARVDAFVNDSAPDAYGRLVDELLNSPHFGERWGRHWLDTARYADSDGYEKDRPRDNAWKYRDWVIDAVNADMPFDQFTIEQLAGDLFPDPTQGQLLATAFNRQTLTNTEGGTDQEQWRVEAIFDRVDTLGTAWLGLTVGCARCHSHKYDQISQREYYQLFAFFNNGDEVTTGLPSSQGALAKYRDQKAVHDAKLAKLTAPLEAAKDHLRPGFAAWEATQRETMAAAAASPLTFHPLSIQSVISEGGATIKQQEDGSCLVMGERPLRDVYAVTIALEQPLNGFKLELLEDETLPHKGPGRADNGNLVLSEITASLARDGRRPADDVESGEVDPSQESGVHGRALPERLSFVSARADFAQAKFPVSQAIDGVEDATGWAISPQFGKNHEAVFALAEPVFVPEGPPGALTVRLSQQYDKSPHTIGRFRLTAMVGIDPELIGLPENIRKLLVIEPDSRTKKQRGELFDYYASLDPKVKKLQAVLDRHVKAAPFNPQMTVRILRERTLDRRETHVMKRGDFLQPLGPVDPATLETLHLLTVRNEESGADRLDLARWLVSPENPLTPRVAVNQVWSHLFGRGLVKTLNDFGVRGEPPTHPQLLDWLASEFIDLGWSRKQLIRTIVLSRTYRQSSAHRPELMQVDPENALLSRQNRFRVEAEIVRDLTLAASGLLDRRIGGPSVFPPLPPGIAELSYANNFKWGSSDWNTRPDKPHGIAPRDDIYRRGLYTFFKRTAAHPTLVTFDCPDANTTCVQRNTSNTPLQALATLNNEVFVTAARALARRILDEVDTNDAERLTYAFRLCAVRPPSHDELKALLSLLHDARTHYGEHPDEAAIFAGEELPAETSADEKSAWVATARILLNLDEFITRE